MHKLTKILTAVTVSATLLAGTVPFISNAAPVMVQDTDTVETRFESSVPAVEEKTSARTDNLKGAVNLNSPGPSYAYSGKDGDITWTIDNYGVLTLTGNGDYSNVTGLGSYPAWYTYRGKITSAVIAITNIRSARKMFAGLNLLNSIEISYFDTSQLKDTSHMFDGCKSLSSLSFKAIPLMGVTDMSYMFNDCESLSELEFMGWYTSNVTNMEYMFAGCKSLPEIELRFFNTSKVTNMSHMFYNCESIYSLHINDFGFTTFDTSNVKDMSYMFAGCTSLRDFNQTNFTIDLNTSNVTNMKGMFEKCTDAIIDVSKFDTSNVTDMGSMFAGCRNISTYSLRNLNTSKVINMNSMFKDCGEYSFLDVSTFNTSNVTDMGYMFSNVECNIINIAGLDTSSVLNMRGMFSGCTAWNFDIGKFNTARVSDMSEMFKDCFNVNSLDFSKFNMQSVNNAAKMFDGCTSVTLFAAPANMKVNIDLPATNGFPWFNSAGKECKSMAANVSSVTTYFRTEAPTVPDKSTPVPTSSPSPKPGPLMTPSASPSVSPSPTVTPSPSPKATASPSPSPKPVATPTASPSPTAEPAPSDGPVEVAKGAVIETNNAVYKVTSNTASKRTVEYTSASKDTVTLKIPNSVKIGGKAFKVTSIAPRALLKNTNTAKVIIGNNVEKIKNGAFRECAVLQEVQIGSKVKEIGTRCFYKSRLLGKIVIKSGQIEKIGDKAFTRISSKAVISVPEEKAEEYKTMIGLNYKYNNL